mgnify:CR=1 FL=1
MLNIYTHTDKTVKIIDSLKEVKDPEQLEAMCTPIWNVLQLWAKHFKSHPDMRIERTRIMMALQRLKINWLWQSF